MTKHFDQAVSAETVNLAAHKIADSGLGDTEPLGCSSLSQMPGFDNLRKLDHEVGASSEILGLFGGESEVSKNIAG